MLVAVWLALFGLLRLILVTATWHLRGDATAGLLSQSFLYGLWFDLSMAAKVVAPFALWRVWRPEADQIERRLVLAGFAVLSLTCVITLIAEVEFYKEFQVRLGPLALEYFGKPEHNRIVLGMIWHGYPVVRWLVAGFAIWAVFFWIGRRFKTPPGRQLAGWPERCVASLLLAGLTVIGARGGFRGSPLRWGDASFSQDAYANHMAQNGLFSLIDTVRHRQRGKNALVWKKSMSRDEAFAAAREVIVRPEEKLESPQDFPLLRRSPAAGPALLKRPRNVVLVLMESFSARFCGATGASFGATPNFDELARQGILFDRAFSVSTHTAQGVFGTLCSFPNLPDYDGVMKQPIGMQPFLALPALLKESGFRTLFLYNGLFSWDNKEGFFRGNGVERFVGDGDYVNPVFVDPDWGVSDLDVFQRANEEFAVLAGTKKPFLGLILTLSNHAPFNLPKPSGLEWLTVGGDQNLRVNGVHYADWALGQFMTRARQSEWFNDTLFVFTGDHGFGIPPLITEAGLLHQHVPILFYGPGIFGPKGEVRHQVISQLDIAPTILGLLGVEPLHQSFGRNVFSLSPEDKGHAYVKASGSPTVGWIEGNEIVIAVPGKAPMLQTYDLGFPPSASADLSHERPQRLREMDRRMRGFVVAGLAALQEHRCAPK